MTQKNIQKTNNFDFLAHHDELLVRLAKTAEACYVSDPNTTLMKMRQLAEAIAQFIAARVGVDHGKDVRQVDLLRELDYKIRLDSRVKEAFHRLRKMGNEATHDFTSNNHRDALQALHIGFAICAWFHGTFGGDAAKDFKAKPFVKPQDPSTKVRTLETELEKLQKQKVDDAERAAQAEKLKEIEAEKAEAERIRAEEMAEQSKLWQEIAEETEAKLAEYQAQMDAANAKAIEQFNNQDAQKQQAEIQRIEKANFELSETETRILIDQQLIEAGWEADTENLRYSKDARPIAGKNMAIAEWPTRSGPADYVLFMGLTPVAIIEAKKQSKNVYSALDQAKRYAEGLKSKAACTIDTQYGSDQRYQVPFIFATNGRPYLKQLEQESGIWFLDVRHSSNRRRALQGWYTPQEIKAQLRQTPQAANTALKDMDFAPELSLRHYQKSAVQAVENSIAEGHNRALIAMATGTGKTRTAIAMIYRLLKTERFRRILFLVDRKALGVQTTNSFAEVKPDGLISFADTFETLGMLPNKTNTKQPEDATKVHVTTVQGLVKRVMYPEDHQTKPSVGQYDCIIVDECHRGYLLDRIMSEVEMDFRDQDDYVSKYRAVIEYFDAFKIGLTATPAQHTTDIFGKPVFTYSYTEAVLDGYLNDHLPPIRIHTKLREQGIHYDIGSEVTVYDVDNASIDTINTPDSLDFDVSQFNRKIIAPESTKTVVNWLIETGAIDPDSQEKTLVFCVNDKHADRVVDDFKAAITENFGGVDDDTVQKITGESDKPLDRIKHFKNDRLPNIAVTVDLLTTGVDVPAICNLVFLRRVNSRILFEQMLGRATRLCPEIGKGAFKIYDAVDIYKQLEKVNTMKPVVTKANISFEQLAQEMAQTHQPELQQHAKDQFTAKLQAKKHHLTETQTEQFKTITGQAPSDFAEVLKTADNEQLTGILPVLPMVATLLDSKSQKPTDPVFIHEGDDEITNISTGYGEGQKPEDYLTAFADFVNAHSNRMQALQVVINRPWELTRQSLKELALELEQNQFREKNLQTAWREAKNEDIAARIIGFIRQAALGDALIPWETRVNSALDAMLASQDWSVPQQKWLELLAKQITANTVVDETSLDEGVFKNKGGSQRANKLFKRPVTEVLNEFNQQLWQA